MNSIIMEAMRVFKIKDKIFTALIVIELLLVLLVLPGCFKTDEMVNYILGEDIYELTVWEEDGLTFRSETEPLKRGVYRVEVYSKLSEGQSMYVKYAEEAAYTKTFQSNGVNIEAGNDIMRFEVYAWDNVPAAHLKCVFRNADALALDRIEVYKTAQGSIMALLMMLLVFGVVDGLYIYRKRVLAGEISTRKQIVFWALIGGIILGYFPYLTDYFSIGADTLYHLQRISHLGDSLLAGGSFPIRVESEWLCDHGYATSLFYGDLLLYVPALLYMAGFSVMTAYKFMVLLTVIATELIAYFCIRKCVKNDWAALCGALMYQIMPLHIYNIYSRSAVGEIQAIIFLPLIFAGMYLMFTEDAEGKEYKKIKWYIIVGLAGVMQTHLISTAMAGIFILVMCFIHLKKTFTPKTFVQLAEAAITSVLLSAWFVIPLVYMMNIDTYYLEKLEAQTVQARGLYFAAYFQFLPNMGTAQTGMYHCEPAQLGAGAILLLGLFFILSLKRKKYNKDTMFWAVLTVVTLVMSSQYLPWDAISKLPLIGYIVLALQFPTRWMALASVFVSFFTAFYVKDILDAKHVKEQITLAVIAVITVFSAVYHVNDIAYQSTAIYLHAAENMGTVSVGNGEYLLEEALITDIYYHKPVAEAGLEYGSYELDGTTIEIELNNTTSEVKHVELPLMGYKGYAVESEDGALPVPTITEETGAHGDLRLEVAGGFSGKIKVFYKGATIFRVSEIVSLITAGAVVVLYFRDKRKKRRNES